jgi:hypothetical protein
MGELHSALQATYQDFYFEPWKFVDNTNMEKFWGDINNQRKFLDSIASQKGLKYPADWFTITSEYIMNAGGGSLLKLHNNSLLTTLSNVYPLHNHLC